ncbi:MULTISPECIES: DUF7518 family protein [Haloprofundus]|uniref:DUF7518 family protein n=1 Tax=Haloprofundus TaxID=1911573 RepID=UPI000E442208|nr:MULTISPECIES: chromosome segregation protein SMC [Haloprofundus]QCJ47493.1 chromosome segregation protein SMC [Haloprofundus sp. MHR1]
MSNRVEELESQVSELRAAVDGLTEELVETKERLRQLEAATDAEPTAQSYAGAEAADEASASPPEPEAEEAKSTEEKAQESESESDESDIIVA